MKGQPNLLNSGYFIPPKPDILCEIQRIQHSAEPDIMQLADLIAQDVGLSAVVLKTINSPIYGLVRKITDIKQSVMILGINFISNLSTFHLLQQSIPENITISLEKFWESSLQTAVLTGMYIKHLDLKRDLPAEDAYTAGLFLNCGIPVMALKYDNYHEILAAADTGFGRLFTDVEDSEFNTNHAVVGYYVTKSWDLPDIICSTIQNHHDPVLLDEESRTIKEKDLFALLKLAENTSNIISFSHVHCEWEQIAHKVLHHFNLDEQELEELQQDVMEQFFEVQA